MITFLGSFNDMAALPQTGGEFAFVGRSNVGKSSLINALVGQKIARSSNTPGRTQSINLFDWDGIILADLLGYGYAVASKNNRLRWLDLLGEYLESGRVRLLFILIDSRRGLMDSDKDIINLCGKEKIPHEIVFTKCDKKDAQKLTGCIITSAKKRLGLEGIKKMISDTLTMRTDAISF